MVLPDDFRQRTDSLIGIQWRSIGNILIGMPIEHRHHHISRSVCLIFPLQ